MTLRRVIGTAHLWLRLGSALIVVDRRGVSTPIGVASL